MYGEDAIDFSCGRCWVCYEGGGKGIGDGSHGGQPAMAAMMETGVKFNRMIRMTASQQVNCAPK